MYSSIGLNLLFVIVIITLLVKYFKLKREDAEFEAEIQCRLTNPILQVDRVDCFTGQVGPFSLGSLENLLGDCEREPLIPIWGRSQNIGINARFQASDSTHSSVSDDTFLRHITKHMSMKTFKPSAPNENDVNESTV